MNDACAEWVSSDSIGGDYDLPDGRRDVAFPSRDALAKEIESSGMTISRGTLAIATAALLLAAASACGDDGADPLGTPTPTLTTSSPRPTTATSTPATDSETAAAAASALIESYYNVRNALRQDSTQPLTLLNSVASGTELAAQRNLFLRERREGLRQVGETTIAELTVESVNLDDSTPKIGKLPTVQIDACFDVSGVDIVDVKGESVVPPERPDTAWLRFIVTNPDWKTDPDAGWRVTSSQDLERTPCAVA